MTSINPDSDRGPNRLVDTASTLLFAGAALVGQALGVTVEVADRVLQTTRVQHAIKATTGRLDRERILLEAKRNPGALQTNEGATAFVGGLAEAEAKINPTAHQRGCIIRAAGVLIELSHGEDAVTKAHDAMQSVEQHLVDEAPNVHRIVQSEMPQE